MKRQSVSSNLRQPGILSRAVKRLCHYNSCNLLWRGSLCVCALLLPTARLVVAGKPATPGGGSKTTVPWRDHAKYSEFVRTLNLPAAKVVDTQTLQYGERLKIKLESLKHMSLATKKELADLFSVPAPFMSKFVERFANAAPPGGDDFAKELNAAVTDYRFLVHLWNEFVSLEGESPKKEARQALEVGDVKEAWRLYPKGYENRPRPEAPQGLRIVGNSAP